MGNRPRTLEKDDILITEGEASSTMYYVQSGTFHVSKKKGGKEITLGHIYSGELVGEMSFLDEKPRSATVKATGQSIVIEIPTDKFKSVLEDQPPWMTALVNTLLNRLRRANQVMKV